MIRSVRAVARQLSKSSSDPPVLVSETPRVRLAAPSLKGVLRIVLITVGCAIALYLVWRVRTVVRLEGSASSSHSPSSRSSILSIGTAVCHAR